MPTSSGISEQACTEIDITETSKSISFVNIHYVQDLGYIKKYIIMLIIGTKIIYL